MRQCRTCGATFTQDETRCAYCGVRLIPDDDREPEGAGETRFWHNGVRRGREGAEAGADWIFSAVQGAFHKNPPPLNIFRRHRRDMAIATILAFLLGTFGAHWFFLGNPGRGFLYLIFFWTGIPTIMGILEGIGFLRGLLRDSNS